MKILLNRAKCLKCGEILSSYTTHDYKSCPCGNLMVDGGNSYIRRGGSRETIEELSVLDNGLFLHRRNNMHWGQNYDKNMKLLPKTIWKPIKQLNSGHLEAILTNVSNLDKIYSQCIQDELIMRENEVLISYGIEPENKIV